MSQPAHPLPTRCPVCAGATLIEKVRCTDCGTAVEGRFSADWPQALTREQLAFVKVFMSCQGKIKDVEGALGISYPTVVSRLEEVVAAIGGSESRRRPPRHDDRKQVLDDLAAGTIDAEEATRRLRRK